jgi:hypothetical protein
VTPQEYAVRAVRAWITNVDLTTIPELQGGGPYDRKDKFIEQVNSAAQEMVGEIAYTIIAERQDEEWQRFRVDWNADGVTDLTYPVRLYMREDGEDGVVR